MKICVPKNLNESYIYLNFKKLELINAKQKRRSRERNKIIVG